MKVICISKTNKEFTYGKWYEITKFKNVDSLYKIMNDVKVSRIYNPSDDKSIFQTQDEWRANIINEILNEYDRSN